MSRLTLSDIASTAFSAGWSHIRDSPPHFGTDSGAFGERLGALALKQTSQSIFNYGIYASLLHDDPRYYVMGRQGSIGVRALYSASRLVITQRDDGRAAINWPKFAGIASATALANAYYPPRDRGFAHGAAAFGISLWTSILNNEIHEFVGHGLRQLRHRGHFFCRDQQQIRNVSSAIPSFHLGLLAQGVRDPRSPPDRTQHQKLEARS